MNILYTLIILCVLIVVHEFGHFIVAKINGVYVEEFSLGMGPKLLQWGKKETKYSIRLFPIGGYVKMTGEDEDSNDPRAFCNKSVLKRMAVIFSGPAMNFIIAIVFFVIAFMYFGVPNNDSVLGEVLPDKPAAVAGLQTGDEIVSINGKPVSNWTEMTTEIRGGVDQELNLQVERNGEQFTTTVVPQLNDNGEYGIIGITQGIAKANLIGSIKLGFVQTYEFSKLLVVSLVDMVTGELKPEVAGPVGIVGIVGDYVDVGFMYLFLLAGILSINLGIMNLLPIPALDGSRLVFLAIEGIRKKPVPADKEAAVHFVGLILMFALMIFITYNDIVRLISS